MQPPHDKLQLLWFGEMVPLGAELPWLRHLFQKSGGLIPGTAARALTLERTSGPSLRMGVLNCYEDTLASVGRRIAVELEPNLIVNVTNDAWFQGTAEPELHARLAVMRAVELRRDLVRAVNLGVVSWVDAAGVVRARYAGDEAATLEALPAIRNAGLTMYARLGDTPLRVAFGIAAAFFALRSRRAKKTKPAIAAD
jgi:apolipoprotein N-acyltransferase